MGLQHLRNYLHWISANNQLINNEAFRTKLIRRMMDTFTRFDGGPIFREYFHPATWGKKTFILDIFKFFTFGLFDFNLCTFRIWAEERVLLDVHTLRF